VWPVLIVVDPRRVQPLLGLGHRQEPVLIWALLPQPATQRVDRRAVSGLPGPREVQRHRVPVSSLVENYRGELCPIVYTDAPRRPSLRDEPVQHLDNLLPLRLIPERTGRLHDTWD